MNSLIIYALLTLAIAYVYHGSTGLARGEIESLLKTVDPRYHRRVWVAFHTVAILASTMLVLCVYLIAYGLLSLLWR